MNTLSDWAAVRPGSDALPITPIDTVRKNRTVVTTGYSAAVAASDLRSDAAMKRWNSCGNIGSANSHRRR